MNRRMLAGKFGSRGTAWAGHSIASGALLVGCLLLCAIVCGCRSSVSDSKVGSHPTIEAQSTSSYDQEIIAAIQKRWYELVGGRPTPRGKVVVNFRCRSDGTVLVIKVIDSDVGLLYEGLCQRAIIDVSPFRPWPQQLKKEVKSGTRDVRFTFYYN